MRKLVSRATVPAVASWLAVLLVVVGLHPVLLGTGPVPETADSLGHSTRRPVQGLDLLGKFYRGTIPASAALVWSLLYVGAYFSLRLSRPADAEPGAGTEEGYGPALPAFAGYFGGWMVAEAGAKPALAQVLTLAIALLIAIVLIRKSPRPARRSPAPPLRSAGLLVMGCVFVLALKPFDVVMASLTGAPQYPELWFILWPALFEPGPLTVPLIALTLTSLPAVLLAGEGGDDGRWVRRALLAAPAWALLLGPSNPFQALGVALILARMRIAGVRVPWRVAFILAVVGLPLLAVHYYA
ncbi:MAG: hypothetical protein O7H41_00930 [Planctomycetota bacterium]|nr:hypothetical protein [Planctomycetota bacterium]